MNAALIFAGGTGTRMNIKTMPKQFLPLHGKPIILYTLEQFEYHPDIDVIVVVCIASWIDHLKLLLKKNNFTKVHWVVPGGSSGQESICNGLKALHEHCPEDTIVLVHDGVRPLVNAQVITDNIACVQAHGNAITTSSAIVITTIAVYRSTLAPPLAHSLRNQQCSNFIFLPQKPGFRRFFAPYTLSFLHKPLYILVNQ